MPSSATRADSSSRADIPLQDFTPTPAQDTANKGSVSSHASKVPHGLSGREGSPSRTSSVAPRRPVPSSTPSIADATRSAPVPATTAQTEGERAELSLLDKSIASLSSSIQQAVVSGASWGFARKTFQDLIPAVAGIIGSKAGGVSGELSGRAVGALIGNVLGGAALGATHYVVEHNAKRVRESIGGAVAMAPKVDSEATKQAIFIATFATFMAMKGLGSSYLPQQGNTMTDAAIGYAIDIAASTAGGFAAEGLTHLLASGYTPVSAKWNSKELQARAGGGVAAGLTSTLTDVHGTATQPAPGLLLPEQSKGALEGAVGAMMALFTWFNARKVITDHQSKAPALPPELEPHLEAFEASLSESPEHASMRDMVREARTASRPSSPQNAPTEV